MRPASVYGIVTREAPVSNVFFMSLVRVPEVFAKVNSAQVPSPFKVGSCREVFVAFHIRAVFT